MRWLIGAAATLGLAASGTVLAQGQGHDKGTPKPAASHAHGKPGNGNGKAGDVAKLQKAVGKPAKQDHGYANKAPDRAPGNAKPQRMSANDRMGDFQTRTTRSEPTRHPNAVADVGRRQSRTRSNTDDAARSGYFLGGRYHSDGDYRQAYGNVPSCPPGLVKKNNGCLPPGLEKHDRDPVFGYSYEPSLYGIFGARGNRYAYRDGYLLPLGSGGSYIPLLGGALTIGRVWPSNYPSRLVPEYVGEYFGINDDDRYRYADDVVYRVDPETAAIEGIAALLTGSDFNVGSQLPSGYDVYNLPASYRDRYADGPDALYRYSDGRIYEVDPETMLIARAIDLVL